MFETLYRSKRRILLSKHREARAERKNGLAPGGYNHQCGLPLDEDNVPDPLHLSLWFPSFTEKDMMLHTLSVLRQVPYSEVRPGVTYLAVHPVSWSEPTVMERRFTPPVKPEEAIDVASELLHGDYAYVFDAAWDLWTPDAPNSTQWHLAPSRLRLIAQGAEFEEGAWEGTGHVDIDFGLDTPFLHEELKLTEEAEQRVRANVARLVDFTNRIDQNCGTNSRLLWSDSEADNLAQKLIARLQKVQ